MTRSRWAAFRETFLVLLLVATLPLPSLLAPPDPVTQFRYTVGALVLTVVSAVALVYGLDYYRIRFRAWSIAGLWVALLVAAVAAEFLAGPPVTPALLAAHAAALLTGLVVGIWLTYHDGLTRLRGALS